MVIAGFAGFVIYEKFTTPHDTPLSDTISTSTSSITYKDGEYLGDIADAYFGKVQVKAIVSGGKLTDVQFLDYPKDQRHSLEISVNSMPLLKSEAIKIQSGKVDIISGATQTAEAFQVSLDSALAKAL